MKKLGLVGGISWTSTLDYYKYINEGINNRLGGLNYAECIIYSLNFGDIYVKTWEGAESLLLDACKNLEKSGAEGILLCANTAHLYAESLQKEISIPLISIITATANEINKQGFKKVLLLGTKYTMELPFYKEGLKSQNIECVVPDEEDRNYIQQTVRDELGANIIKNETKQQYTAIIDKWMKSGIEAVVLGCTEIPLLIKQEDISIPVLDTTKIHSRAAVDFALDSCI